MIVRDIAFARCGDKGNSNNICVFTYRDDHYRHLVDHLTAEAVRGRFGELVRGDIARYEIPRNQGLNFVLTESLDGGVSMSLRLDPHGKALASLLLGITIPDLPHHDENRQRGTT